MPRFVILHHRMPPESDRGEHWDLMLEEGELLRTWALASPPAAGKTIDATQLADHRLAYLEYEGPVSGNRGEVWQWDAGQYQTRRATSDQLVIDLEGKELIGCLTLQNDPEQPQRWTACFKPEGSFAV